ncbi:hypothetical protein [Thermobrachium celere]|uniref:Uncharacterized protein n=1 Tax=Thermobrachium celere DSM 8682 TaxID=941824 RepID=R7RR20_9CLOT|nr:hypothetical protein [Thermobrachium celere]CDF58637.1 hypothetical protein TCEL_00683 [Thermobrachium celere DSM 8682]
MRIKVYAILGILMEVIYLLIFIPKLRLQYIPFDGPTINKFLVYKMYFEYLDKKDLLLNFILTALFWSTIFTIATLSIICLINTVLRNKGKR